MTVKLGYTIHFVADMDRAVSFYRDTLGLTLKFASPAWTEFATGETTLALHPASSQNPAGSTQLGFVSAEIEKLHRDLAGKAWRSRESRRRNTAFSSPSSSIARARGAA